ncbi:hypothetical protein HU200_040302 [Digitaria exilis]|uniref:RNase H type-1 domain-containing protein n=1 Tax=Digitaria exilis TaxID=1010633 RepID=A0A835B924_9POAL|nr:hypothetical protein HU200_040302 [Digitaria exilis]
MADRRRRGGSPDTWDGTWEGEILDVIYGYYKSALDALPLEEMPSLAPRLLAAGVCFGFADPVTNIIANTLSFGEPDGAERRKRKRSTNASGEARLREEVLSKIVAGEGPSAPEVRTIAERSLEGLVSFLVSYFRYLPTWDALRYLSLARADLLVAGRCRLTVKDVSWLSRLLAKPLKLKKSDEPMKLVRNRFHDSDVNASIENVPGQLTVSLRSILMDRVHEHYLKAVSRFPMKDLQSRHHRGLLKAGYCFGPLDPVSNIIVNTVCGYKAAAKAASHPNPEAYCEFVLRSLSGVRYRVRSLLQGSHVLPASNILSLSALLSISTVEPPEPVIELTEDAMGSITKYKEEFLSQQSLVHRKVEATLRSYGQSQGCHYDLGVICGLNDCVGEETGIFNTKYQYTHANFWATQSDGTNTLFFVEFSNDEGDDYKPFCCPLSEQSTQEVRCCYCEFHGVRMVHPVEALLTMRSMLEQGEDGIMEASSKGKGPMHDWQEDRNTKVDHSKRSGQYRWQLPSPGWVKVNVDGSYVAETGTTGVGVVARNSLGDIVFTAWRVLLRCADVAKAEARACVEGLRLATQWAPEPVIVESDCARIVKAMQGTEDRSDIGFIIAEARELGILLPEWKVALVKRECNTITNELARTAHTAVWIGQAPTCVKALIVSDCNSAPS